MNKQLSKLAEKESVAYLNLRPLFLSKNQKLGEEYTTDGLHLNEIGYKVWSTELSRYIN